MSVSPPLFNAAFTRAIFLQPLLKALNRHYSLSPAQLDIPEVLYREPMRLIPFSDINRWLENMERQTGDPAFMVKLAEDLTFREMDRLGEWFLSSPELALSFRRINYGTSCLQAGATFYGEQSGKFIKWCYDNHFSHSRGRLHDSLRMAIMFTNTLRDFLGHDYQPLNVEISGPPCGEKALRAFFGCDIRWNAPKTEVWLYVSVLEQSNQHLYQSQRPMMLSNLELDEFLNMPQPHDAAKTVYEMINYSRCFGFPSLDTVAGKFSLSPQQFQRRLRLYGWNFTSITSYVLCNQAIQYMQADIPIAEIAAKLGYSNVQSFSKAFQRQRRETPTQYKEKLLERMRH